MLKKPSHTNNLHKKLTHTKNSHKNQHTNPQTSIIIMIINIFVVINQINKHKVKICNHCMYTQIIIKRITSFLHRV